MDTAIEPNHPEIRIIVRGPIHDTSHGGLHMVQIIPMNGTDKILAHKSLIIFRSHPEHGFQLIIPVMSVVANVPSQGPIFAVPSANSVHRFCSSKACSAFLRSDISRNSPTNFRSPSIAMGETVNSMGNRGPSFLKPSRSRAKLMTRAALRWDCSVYWWC